MAQNILFYSDRCQLSKKFMMELNKAPNGLWDTFIKINVDTHRHKVPPIIKMVPTIVVQNYPKPIETSEAMTWLNSMVKAVTQKDLESYQPAEMGTAFTDSFAFIDLNAPAEKLFTGTKQSFSYFDDEAANKLISASASSGPSSANPNDSSSKDRRKQSELDKRLEDMHKERMKVNPQGPVRM